MNGRSNSEHQSNMKCVTCVHTAREYIFVVSLFHRRTERKDTWEFLGRWNIHRFIYKTTTNRYFYGNLDFSNNKKAYLGSNFRIKKKENICGG